MLYLDESSAATAHAITYPVDEYLLLSVLVNIYSSSTKAWEGMRPGRRTKEHSDNKSSTMASKSGSWISGVPRGTILTGQRIAIFRNFYYS